MEISKGIEIVDLGLKIGKALIIGDLHIGFEEALNKQGIMVPRFQFQDLVQRLEKMIAAAEPKIIIVNGDIKHEFGRISKQEWRDTIKMIDLLKKNRRKVILIRGNHDKVLGPIAEKRGIEIVDSYMIKDVLILHGHKEEDIPQDVKRIVIGHDHPAVTLREGPRQEKFKCFLRGKYHSKELIVIPSMNLATEGSDVMQEDMLSPFLKRNLDEFEVFIVSDKAYYFGKLKNIKNYD